MDISSQYCPKSLVSFSFVFFLITSILITVQGASGQQLVCPERAIEQITNEPEGSSIDIALSGDGTRIAIRSDANINGGNPGGIFQIYLFDTTDRTFTQITNETNGSDDPSINFDGTRIAFESTANINGGNPEGNNEVFLFDTTTGEFTQITNENSGTSGIPSINADGTRIAFRSDADINGGNPGGIDQIFLFDTTTGVFTQITDDMFERSDNPSINADGTKIAFDSSANINGGNPGGIDQIFLFDTTTGVFTQITDDMFERSNRPSINADGTRIAFQSEANINGGNPDGNTEVFLFDTTTGEFTQITDETSGNSNNSSINADGTRIAFDSNANINGGNLGGIVQIFLFDTTTGTFLQITQDTSDTSDDPSISADGTRIAFDSRANINGGNPEGNSEVFLAVCFDPETFRNIPTLSEWGLIAMAAVLGLIGFMAIRKRKAVA